jgi:serine/threonine protein phosphatase 1
MNRQTDPRRFVIGDIHGCYKTFAVLLNQLDLQKTDTLFLLGDYIDRGPNSKGVLDRIMTMQAEGYDLRPLRGNHEQMLLDALVAPEAFTLWKGNGGYSTLQEFGVTHPSDIPNQYLEYLYSLPFMHLEDDYVFVHAGLNFSKSDPIAESSHTDILWGRDFKVNSAKLAGRILVTGHTVTPLYAIKTSLSTSHITLDNGCYDKGEMSCGALVALNLDTWALQVQPNIE